MLELTDSILHKIQEKISWTPEYKALYVEYMKPILSGELSPTLVYVTSPKHKPVLVSEITEEIILLGVEVQFLMSNGGRMRYSRPMGLPAYISPWSIEWYEDGKPHRPGSFWCITYNGKKQYTCNI